MLEDGVKQESMIVPENRDMLINGNATSIIYSAIAEDNNLYTTYGGSTIVQEGLKQEADMKVEDQTIRVS